ncbi:slit homolog 2 protein-like [Bacillus rossius redtenbacheri]|uniref:slit homolog 2 protein-like n=1 Tax=Bacillus rossius redtenbacheri TaxID=93214 RepID=UPI002FDC8004
MAPPLPAGCMFLVLALITDVMFDEVRNVTVKDAVILSNLSYQDLANLGLRDVPQAVPRGTEALLFSGNNVTSLSGQFWTRGCQKGVTTAGCSLLPYIAVLDLSNNLIETTDRHCFGGMERLHLLLLQNNRLRTIGPDTFADKRLLIWLDMSGNRISYLHPETFQGSKNLQHLFLNCNVIRDIHVDTFRGLGQLRQMSLEDNNISVVDAHLFRDLINLYALKLDFNYLSYIPGTIFLHLRKLQIFSASHNIIWSFSSMFFPSARNLRSVDLSHNSIRHLSRYDFQNLEEIAHVNFSYNNLKSLYLSRIPVARIVTSSTNWLIRNTSLCTGSNGNFPCFFPRNNLETDKVFHSVDFSYNKVSKIIFVISDSSHTLVIIKISLAGNRGFFFPVSFIRQERYITALDLNQTNLSWRNMTLFDEILQLPHLKSLSISGSEACGHHMKQVLMSIFNHNYRVHLNCDGFPPPTGTDLYAAQPDSLDNSSYGLANNGNCNSTPEENGWSEVDGDSGYFPCQYFESFTTITVDFIGMNYDIFCGYAVDCSYVSLSTLPRINSSVDCILLSHNELTFLEPGFFPNFHDLWYLDLSFNGLTSLGEGVFERLVNLVFLNLNGNQLSSLSSHAFEDLVHLTMLTMHGNRISSYDPDTFGNQARLRLLSVDFRNLTRFHEGTLRNLPALQVLELRETCELATSRHLLGAVHFKSLRSLKSCRITGFLINSSSPGDLFEASALDLLEIKDISKI